MEENSLIKFTTENGDIEINPFDIVSIEGKDKITLLKTKDENIEDIIVYEKLARVLTKLQECGCKAISKNKTDIYGNYIIVFKNN